MSRSAPFATSHDDPPPPPNAGGKYKHASSEVKSLLYGGDPNLDSQHSIGKKMVTRGTTEAPFAVSDYTAEDSPYAGHSHRVIAKPGDVGNKFAVGASKVGTLELDVDASRNAYLGSRNAAAAHLARNHGGGNILSHAAQ